MPDGIIYTFGAGAMSCGEWNARGADRRDAETWVIGYWSGRNSALERKVGFTTDANGILGEVDKECAAEPSQRLFSAVDAAYQRLTALGR